MVATVFSLNSASSTVEYFEFDSYYTKGAHRRASRWHGEAAAALGLIGSVDPREFRAVLEGHVPGTDLRLGRVRDGKHQHRPGMDITCSAPKSASAMALLPGGDRRVLRASDEAVRAMLDFIERELLLTRQYNPLTRRHARVPLQGMICATFRHITSRNLDPQLHTHCVLVNMSRDADGQWRVLELGRLLGAQHLLGAVYRSELAWRLRQQGYALVPSMIGHVRGFEIAGVSPQLRAAFSSRRAEMLSEIEAHGLDYSPAVAQRAVLITRKEKKPLTQRALRQRWSDHLGDLGLHQGLGGYAGALANERGRSGRAVGAVGARDRGAHGGSSGEADPCVRGAGPDSAVSRALARRVHRRRH